MIEKIALIKAFLQRLANEKYKGRILIDITFSEGGIRGLKFFRLKEES